MSALLIGHGATVILGRPLQGNRGRRLLHAGVSLLNDVGQFVGQQGPAAGGGGVVLSLGKIDVVSAGEGLGADRAAKLASAMVCVDANAAEIGTDTRLKK